jgi:hypothetical protein
MSTLLFRLAPDERASIARTHLGKQVRIVFAERTYVAPATGWLISVAGMLSGTTTDVIVVREDLKVHGQDWACSLAQVATITPLELARGADRE